MPEKTERFSNASRIERIIRQLESKGPLFLIMGAVIVCLYSWVVDNNQKQEARIIKLEAKGENRDKKLEAYQKYVQGELFQKLDQSNRVIERNTYVLEEISRKLDEKR